MNVGGSLLVTKMAGLSLGRLSHSMPVSPFQPGVAVAYRSGRFCTISTCVAGKRARAPHDATAPIRPRKRARTPSNIRTPFILCTPEIVGIHRQLEVQTSPPTSLAPPHCLPCQTHTWVGCSDEINPTPALYRDSQSTRFCKLLQTVQKNPSQEDYQLITPLKR